MKKYYMLLISAFFVPILLVILVLFRGQKDVSYLENRTLQKFPPFSLASFINGDYQSALESSLSDQLMFSETIKINTKKINNIFQNGLTSLFVKISPKQCKNYIEIANDYYVYNCSNYLIKKPYFYNENSFSHFKDIYNSINAEKYIYFIEKDTSIDFTKNIAEKEIVFNDIKNNFDAKEYGRFELASYEDLEKYFYQTDHHWNYRGSYLGYTEIIGMLLGEEEKLLVPKNTVTYDVVFNGSASRNSLTNTSKEKFTVYEYENMKFDCYINDQKATYGGKEKYDNNEFQDWEYANHYGLFYGDDYAKILYDFNQSSKENLLIIATSYSNAINSLIASHFNKTHIIDLRHYSRQYGEEINFNEYIKINDIDKVLIMGDIASFTN